MHITLYKNHGEIFISILMIWVKQKKSCKIYIYMKIILVESLYGSSQHGLKKINLRNSKNDTSTHKFIAMHLIILIPRDCSRYIQRHQPGPLKTRDVFPRIQVSKLKMSMTVHVGASSNLVLQVTKHPQCAVNGTERAWAHVFNEPIT